MKTCNRCKIEKELEQFHKRGPSGRQTICKHCRKTDDAERFKADPVHHNEVNKARRAEYTQMVRDLKSGPCTDCGGIFHPAAMQWDHTGSDKLADVSDAVSKLWSKARILAEIDKCELVCANCHAVRTYTRRMETSGGITRLVVRLDSDGRQIDKSAALDNSTEVLIA